MTFGSGNPETEEEYWICQRCFTSDVVNMHGCTGFAIDLEDNEAYACECRCRETNNTEPRIDIKNAKN